ncbi:cytochrome P450 [Apiospora arundinis]|uniref:MFS multidrug transporter n=1 Tax=Apiospora arundinis TaxID=335852 RepID=A0ABR2IU33_9PEZI
MQSIDKTEPAAHGRQDPEKTDEPISSTDASVKYEPDSNESPAATSSVSKGEGTERGEVEYEPEWVSGWKLALIMSAVTLPCFLLLLDMSIIVTAIPQITGDFHSLPDVGWYGAAFMISSAVLQPLTGRFYTNFSSKWTFVCFFALFELGSLLCGVATSSVMLIVGRAVAGMGASGIQNGAFTIIAGCVPLQKRPPLIGFASGFAQLGLVTGPLIGGALTEHATWRWCFYINLPVGGVVLALIAFIHVPDQVPKPPPMSVLRTLPSKLDFIGFLIFAPSAVMLLLALQWGGNAYAWNSSQIIGLFVGAAAMFVVFVAWDYYKGDAAMIPFSIIRQRYVWSAGLTYGLFMGQVLCVSYYLPIYFQGVRGATPTMSGVYLLPSVVPHIIFSLSAGWLMGRVGYYLPFSLVGGTLASISNGLLSTLSPTTSTAKWIGYQIIGGAGRGIGLQGPLIAVQNTVRPSQIPVAMAFVMFSQAFGGALWLAFCDLIFTNGLRTLIPVYAPSVDPQAVIDGGARGLADADGKSISGADALGVLVAYAKTLDRDFYFAAGISVASFLTAWFMGFKDIRKKKPVSEA